MKFISILLRILNRIIYSEENIKYVQEVCKSKEDEENTTIKMWIN